MKNKKGTKDRGYAGIYVCAILLSSLMAVMLHNTAAGTIITLICLCGATCGIVRNLIEIHKLGKQWGDIDDD